MKRTVLCLLLVACGNGDPAKADPCPQGICIAPTSADGGPGPGTTGPGGGPAGGPTACVVAWTCTAWEKTPQGQYARSCTDTNKCGTTSGKPVEGPIDLPNLDIEYFKCKVEPIFDRGCSMMGCHGTEVGRPFKVYSRGRLRNKETVPPAPTCLDTGPQDLAVKGSGTVMCLGWSKHTASEWQQNFDNARSFMVGLTNPDDSELLSQAVYGGKAHTGVHLYKKTDPDYQTISAWLSGAQLGSVCNPSPN